MGSWRQQQLRRLRRLHCCALVTAEPGRAAMAVAAAIPPPPVVLLMVPPVAVRRLPLPAAAGAGAGAGTVAGVAVAVVAVVPWAASSCVAAAAPPHTLATVAYVAVQPEQVDTARAPEGIPFVRKGKGGWRAHHLPDGVDLAAATQPSAQYV